MNTASFIAIVIETVALAVTFGVLAAFFSFIHDSKEDEI